MDRLKVPLLYVRDRWVSVRSNRYLVAFEGGAGGVVLDAVCSGHISVSKIGLHNLLAAAVVGGATAVKFLMRQPPNPTRPVSVPADPLSLNQPK